MAARTIALDVPTATPLTRMKLALEMMPEATYKNSIQEDVNEIRK